MYFINHSHVHVLNVCLLLTAYITLDSLSTSKSLKKYCINSGDEKSSLVYGRISNMVTLDMKSVTRHVKVLHFGIFRIHSGFSVIYGSVS